MNKSKDVRTLNARAIGPYETGRYAEAEGSALEALSRSGNSRVRDALRELSQVRLELAKMQFAGSDSVIPEFYRKRIGELTGKKESLEVELKRLSSEFALEKTSGRADAKGIAMLLPKDSVYLDFARIDLYDFKAKKWKAPHYLAFVLTPGKDPEVKLLDMGKAETIDTHIHAYRREMNQINVSGMLPDQEILTHETMSLYGKIMEPLGVTGRTRSVVSRRGLFYRTALFQKN